MGAEWKGRAAKGQAGWGWRTLRKSGPLCSGLLCVMVRPLVAMVGMSPHLPGQLPAQVSMPEKGLPSKSFVALLLSGALVFQSSSVMVGLYHQYIRGRRGWRKPLALAPPFPPPFANEEPKVQREKATYPRPHNELGMLREGFKSTLGTSGLLSSSMSTSPPTIPGSTPSSHAKS